ncbi:hypothetical protein VIGAN_09046400, partial [Vigna angularis var. angularis]
NVFLTCRIVLFIFPFSVVVNHRLLRRRSALEVPELHRLEYSLFSLCSLSSHTFQTLLAWLKDYPYVYNV